MHASYNKSREDFDSVSEYNKYLAATKNWGIFDTIHFHHITPSPFAHIFPMRPQQWINWWGRQLVKISLKWRATDISWQTKSRSARREIIRSIQLCKVDPTKFNHSSWIALLLGKFDPWFKGTNWTGERRISKGLNAFSDVTMHYRRLVFALLSAYLYSVHPLI